MAKFLKKKVTLNNNENKNRKNCSEALETNDKTHNPLRRLIYTHLWTRQMPPKSQDPGRARKACRKRSVNRGTTENNMLGKVRGRK